MKQEFLFDTHKECLAKWHELVDSGVSKKEITLIAPHPVHGLDETLDPAPSRLRYITFFAGLTGCLSGFALTIYTSAYSWPLNSGGKPMNSIPAFIIIAFELTILFGGVISLFGFMLLARLPDIKKIISPEEYGNKYAIIVNRQDPE